MDNYCVYILKNKINQKIYIGLTNNTARRWRSGGIEYKPRKENTRPLWNAIQKYGWENFEKSILENALSQEEAEKKEKYYIEYFNSRDKTIGYNVAEGGNGGRIWKVHPRGMLGKKQSEKGIAAARNNGILAGILKKNTSWKRGHPRGMLGKTHSVEYIEKLKNRTSDKHPSAKKIIFYFPNGVTKEFGCIKYAIKEMGVTDHFIRKLLKNEKPYILSPKVLGERRKFLKNFEGVIIKEIF